MPETNLPTKKQRELLQFIDGFIKGNGYGPSYREIMRALGYKSVSTVAVHVDGLIARGWLIKRDKSARSLEVIDGDEIEKPARPDIQPDHLTWLREQVEKFTDRPADQEIITKAVELLDPER